MIPTLPYLDRYRNEGTRVYSRHAGYSEAGSRYRPDSAFPDFEIPAFAVPSQDLNLFRADPHPQLLETFVLGSRTLFVVHPQVLESPGDDPYVKQILAQGEETKRIRVSPSSSTRTLYVLDSHPPHALKVHFPFRVSRYGRRMREEVIEQAIRVSGELQAGLECMGPGFAFLREVAGVTFKDLQPHTPRGENWGYLVREMTPFPAVAEERPLVPGFSLYGKDFFDLQLPLLIFELLEGQDPRAYVLEQIMLPIIRHWVTCFLRFGLLLEPHGQNVLLEIGKDREVQRVVFRDLNLGIDNRRRRDLGMPLGGPNTYNQMESGEFNSITYDKFMGGHFFDLLARTLLERDSHLSMEDFREPCRNEFAQLFPNHEEYMPRTVQYFSEVRDRFGKPTFMDTGKPPDWRP